MSHPISAAVFYIFLDTPKKHLFVTGLAYTEKNILNHFVTYAIQRGSLMSFLQILFNYMKYCIFLKKKLYRLNQLLKSSHLLEFQAFPTENFLIMWRGTKITRK